MEVSEKCP